MQVALYGLLMIKMTTKMESLRKKMDKLDEQMALLQRRRDEVEAQLNAEQRRAQARAVAKMEKLSEEATVRSRCGNCGETFRNSKVLEKCPFCGGKMVEAE